MTPSSGVSRYLSQVLILLVLTSISSAAVALNELLSTFSVEMREDIGGTCNRDYDLDFPTPMLPKVLAAYEDAWLLAAYGLENPSVRLRRSAQDTQAFVQLRGLLFLWFGILLTDDGAFSSPEDASAYATVMGRRNSHQLEQVDVYAYSTQNCADEFAGANATRTHPENVYGYGLPLLRCLEDYASFYQFEADAEGDENLDGENPAEIYGVRCMMDQPISGRIAVYRH